MRRIKWIKSHQNPMKNKISHSQQNDAKLHFSVILTPFILKTVKDRKNLLTYYWKLWMRRIKWKKSHQNPMKNKKFPSPAKSHFYPLLPLLYKKRSVLKKIAWSNICSPSNKESFKTNPVQIRWIIKKFKIWRSAKMYLFTTLTQIISKTVRDSKILLTYYRKLSLRGIQWKKSHQNPTKNKNLPYPRKWHFWTL